MTPLIGQEERVIRAPGNGTVVLRRLGGLTSNSGEEATLNKVVNLSHETALHHGIVGASDGALVAGASRSRSLENA